MSLQITQILEATGGGSRKHVLFITRELIRRGHGVNCVFSTRRADPDFADDLAAYKELGCAVEILDMAKLPTPHDYRVCRQFHDVLTQQQADVVHSHCGKAGFISRLTLKFMGRRAPAAVHTPHSYYFQGFNSAWRKCLAIRLERFLSRTGRLFCIAKSEMGTIANCRIAPAAKVDLGQNGLPADFRKNLLSRDAARQRLHLDTKRVVVGVCARLVARKGHKWLLRAIAELPSDIQAKALFLFIGRGPEKERIEERIAQLDLTDCVQCPGYIPHVDRLTQALDLAVIPSYYEGLSYQLLETLSADVPLIASDVPGNHFDLPGNPICYVSADDVSRLATKLNDLITSPERRRELGRAGRRWAETHFSLSAQVDALLESYDKAIDGR